MKKIFFALFFVTFTTIIFAQNMKVTSSSITFKIKNAGFNVAGKIQGFNGNLNFEPNNLAGSSIAASVDTKTIDTDNNLRNRHLKEKEEFFNVAKFPTIEMKSSKFEKSGDTFMGTFDLTMKGITKAVKVPFSVSQTGSTMTFTSTFTINRRDWEVGGSSWMMSDTATITVTVNAQK